MTDMTDRIIIKDLFLRTIIGINDDERSNRQDVLINLELETDTRAAGKSDRIEDAVNYKTITKQVIDLIEGSRYFLVEKMAEEIAQLCLADRRVSCVKVTIEKPAALRFARSVGVSIERSRGDA
jgi:dihydroneopterin aldolase/D-erythro-7,8-dihydroneopterin triphosphate epimerase